MAKGSPDPGATRAVRLPVTPPGIAEPLVTATPSLSPSNADVTTTESAGMISLYAPSDLHNYR